MIVDLRRIEARHGRAGKEGGKQCGAVAASSFNTSAPPAISARMARIPLPAEGSNTQSADVIAAAVQAARPSVIGVENCWSAWLSSERRVWVGRRPTIFAQCDQSRGRGVGFAENRLSVFAQEQDSRCLAGVIGRLPVPCAGGIGDAEGCLHRGAQDAGIDALPAFEIGKEKSRGLEDGGGSRCRRIARPGSRR